MPEHQEPGRDEVANASELAWRRMTEYVDLWEQAASKLSRSEYHADDLLDDWFTLWAKWVRDTSAAATVLWSAYAPAVDRRANHQGGHDGP